jgi:ATP synthase protein I
MTSNAEPGPASGNGSVGVSGPTRSLWLGLLGLSSAVAGGALILTGVVAALLNGWTGVVSSSLGGLLVVVFFAISLLIGHFVGRNNPSGPSACSWRPTSSRSSVSPWCCSPSVLPAGCTAAGSSPAPSWPWSLWQAAEIYGFSKARLQIFNDPEPEATPDRTGDPRMPKRNHPGKTSLEHPNRRPVLPLYQATEFRRRLQRWNGRL